MKSQARFGSCILDFESHRLVRDGHERHLTPKAFELLRLLVESEPKALTKEELLDAIWPNTSVSDDALARLVADVRVALGDSAREPKWIRTIHGFGYAFKGGPHGGGPQSAVAAPCWLIWGSREYRLQSGENTIGRDPDVTVPLNSPIVSRRHARITIEGSHASIEDLESKNGTSVGEAKISSGHALKNGDIIRIGDFELTFRVRIDTPTVTHAS